ncbi:MAG TPA: M24 family metallopeptidase [Meiothermus sp.]|nr:M24 family metallopeptidase [Meiothermus sp.]
MKPIQLEPPPLEVPAEVPEIPRGVYERRYERLEQARIAAGFDVLLIYADREHGANLAWLTGFDPRFEEALWVQGPKSTLLVGNENLGYAPMKLNLEAEVALFTPFSLPGQDWGEPDLIALLRKAGLARGLRVGVLGWKPLPRPEVPFYLVAALQEVCGSEPENANDLLMHPETGLRATLEPEQIRLAEYGSSLTSAAILNWLRGLREGMTEREAAGNLVSYGLELTCHPMVNFGPTIPSGLGSPRNERLVRGEYAQVALGVLGGLTCRAGRLVRRNDPDADGYLELVTNYLEVVRAWYAALRVGVSTGEVFAAAQKAKAETWDLALNPGHLIHLEEWLHSPFAEGSRVALRSGYAIQQDIIPVPRNSVAVINMEDGIVLADGDLRGKLGRLDPALMHRCQLRREWMERLGYALSEDVLPLSNLAGAFFPFLLEGRYVAALE